MSELDKPGDNMTKAKCWKCGADQNQEYATKPSPKLIPLSQWNKHHDWPPVGGLRHLAFYMPPGAETFVIRAAGRVLIDEEAFFAWVKQGGAKSTETS